MKSLALIDSGEWTTPDCRISEPRVYPVIRQLITEGKIEITSMFYIESPSKPFPSALKRKAARKIKENGRKTDREIEEEVNQDRRCVERKRVAFTAERFSVPLENIKDIKDIKKDIDADIIIISDRPDKHRNDVIEALLDQTQAKFIVITPYFSNVKEIKALKEIPGAEDRLIPYLPYRFATGVLDAADYLNRDALKVVAAQLHVTASQFRVDSFIAEFCMPFLDVLGCFVGSTTDIEVFYTTPDALPVISATARHENDGVSSLLLSCAGGSLQHTDHCQILLFTSSPAFFELSRSLTLCTYRSAAHHVTRQFSHDIVSAAINGSQPLMEKILGLSKSPCTTLPRLSTFLRTQILIEDLVKAVGLQQEETNK